MYQWYENAELCLAYLSDIDSLEYGEDDGDGREQFRQSKSFTRGWTLQELLAPHTVEFYDYRWQKIGSRSGLKEIVEAVTSIPKNALHLRDAEFLHNYSVAPKMSWASNRLTSRREDVAYCLLGIFDINMPLLYGEGGEKAFGRLQEEILKNSYEESIFAFRVTYFNSRRLLAEDPSDFAGCREVRQLDFDSRPHYSMTNKGLQIDVQKYRHPLGWKNVYIVPLNCIESKELTYPVTITICLINPPGQILDIYRDLANLEAEMFRAAKRGEDSHLHFNTRGSSQRERQNLYISRDVHSGMRRSSSSYWCCVYVRVPYHQKRIANSMEQIYHEKADHADIIENLTLQRVTARTANQSRSQSDQNDFNLEISPLQRWMS